MKSDIKFLERVEVAAPCHADWEKMQGDERARFCQDCKLSVYNLSDMSKVDAENLLHAYEGKGLCVRFFRRKDGTILTDNCPVGLRRLRKIAIAKWSAILTAASTLFYYPLRMIGRETGLKVTGATYLKETTPMSGKMKMMPVEPVQKVETQGMTGASLTVKPEKMVLGEAVEGRASLKVDKNSP